MFQNLRSRRRTIAGNVKGRLSTETMLEWLLAYCLSHYSIFFSVKEKVCARLNRMRSVTIEMYA